jgi:hypothetical protein
MGSKKDSLLAFQDVTRAKRKFLGVKELGGRIFSSIEITTGDHFSSPNMEIKKNRDSPHKGTLV